MTTLDDGDVVQQARRNDPRITPPRALPAQMEHRRAAAAHQRAQGRHVAGRPAPARALAQSRIRAEDRAYARRPQRVAGITGWAQVNGFRGETDTDEKMKRRVDHDLYYIDNWSLWLDLRILLLTLFSRGH
jgi:hypothetical protein